MRKDNVIKEQEVRKCKNKSCQKPLPEGYKHKYCENCRNNQAYVVKNGLKGLAAAGTTALGLCICIVTKGKFGGKDA